MGRRLWLLTHTSSDRAEVTVRTPTYDDPVVIEFIGILGDPTSTVINVADVQYTPGECHRDNVTCEATEFLCGSGECVETEKQCNGVVDCEDESDELHGCGR